jgi:hypothetical protein
VLSGALDPLMPNSTLRGDRGCGTTAGGGVGRPLRLTEAVLECAVQFSTPDLRTDQGGKCERGSEKGSGVQFGHQARLVIEGWPRPKTEGFQLGPLGATGRSGLDAGDYSSRHLSVERLCFG